MAMVYYIYLDPAKDVSFSGDSPQIRCRFFQVPLSHVVFMIEGSRKLPPFRTLPHPPRRTPPGRTPQQQRTDGSTSPKDSGPHRWKSMGRKPCLGPSEPRGPEPNHEKLRCSHTLCFLLRKTVVFDGLWGPW